MSEIHLMTLGSNLVSLAEAKLMHRDEPGSGFNAAHVRFSYLSGLKSMQRKTSTLEGYDFIFIFRMVVYYSMNLF